MLILHAKTFEDSTFELEVDENSPAFETMLRNVCVRVIKNKRHRSHEVSCVRACDLAEVINKGGALGEWIVNTRRALEMVRFGYGDTYYIDYGDD